MSPRELSSITRAIGLWDGSPETIEQVVHTIEGVSHRARKGPIESGTWMRFEALVLAMLARVDPGDPEGRGYFRRLLAVAA